MYSNQTGGGWGLLSSGAGMSWFCVPWTLSVPWQVSSRVLRQTGPKGAVYLSAWKTYPSKMYKGKKEAFRPEKETPFPDNFSKHQSSRRCLPASPTSPSELTLGNGTSPWSLLFSIPSKGWACGECSVDSAQQPGLLF